MAAGLVLVLVKVWVLPPQDHITKPAAQANNQDFDTCHRSSVNSVRLISETEIYRLLFVQGLACKPSTLQLITSAPSPPSPPPHG
jgi:hypothetical protein